MSYNPTPSKLAAFGFQQDKEQLACWRRFNGQKLYCLTVYEKGFELTISMGYPGVYAMRFSPASESFFDELMGSIGE